MYLELPIKTISARINLSLLNENFHYKWQVLLFRNFSGKKQVRQQIKNSQKFYKKR